jgi:hypothetical protein
MMTDANRNEIFEDLNQRETGELIEIWQQQDTAEWSDTALEMVAQILRDRQVDINAQGQAVYPEAEVVETEEAIEAPPVVQSQGQLLDEVIRRRNMTRVALGISVIISLYFLFRTLTGALSWPFAVLGLVYLGLNIWRYYKIDRQVKKYTSR